MLFFSTYFFSSENFRGSNKGVTKGFHAFTVPNDRLKSIQACLNVGHCVPLTSSARFIRNSSQISLENIDNGLKIMNSIEEKHKEMLGIDQYSMVVPFIRAIQKYIEDPIAERMLDGDLKEGDTIKIGYSKDDVTVDVVSS